MDRAALKIEYRNPAHLKASSRNARTHSRAQLKQIAASIRKFGMVTPVGINQRDQLIFGHARVEAAKLAGLEAVPVVRLSHLTGEEQRAYLLADNRLALDAGWDQDLLAAELRELSDLDFDLSVTGFSIAELDAAVAKAADSLATDIVGDEAENVVPPLPKRAICRHGDIWELGRHRLLCGDARDCAAFEQLLGSETAGMVFTDPPYNVKIAGNVSGLGQLTHREFVMGSGEMSNEQFVEFLQQTLGNASKSCRDGAIAYVCMDWRHIGEIIAAGKRVFSELKNVCVWNKKVAGMGTFYRSKHELVFVFKVGTAPHVNSFGLGGNGRYRTNVWDYAGVLGNGTAGRDELAMHPTVKPVELIADAMKDCSKRGDIVLDPFAGSGSTLIAAQKCGRKARLIEYDPLYCDTIIARYVAFTGLEARLLGGGTFEEVAEERSALLESA